MSCACGHGCQPGCGCYVVNLPDNPVVGYSAANINLTGVGVYDSTAGTEFDFRGVTSATGALTVTLDAVNHTIVLTLDIPSIIDDLPTATTVQRGVGETATDAEALAKAAVDKFLTPSNLAALGASLTFAGLTEYATGAETLAMASNVLAVTPLGLASLITTLEQTTTWADGVARAALAPSFAGQFGTQLDTDIPFVSTGVAAGDFDQPLFALNNASNQITANTTLEVFGGGIALTFTTGGGGEFIIASPWTVQGGATFEFNGGILNFQVPGSAFLQINGAAVPANSVMITSGVAGDLTSVVTIGTFISTFDVQIGYTAFANGAVLRTCDTTTVTLPQLAQIVGTLIEDLKAVQLPAT